MDWPAFLAFPIAPLIVVLQAVALLLRRPRLRLVAALAAPTLLATMLVAVVLAGPRGDDDAAFYGLIGAFAFLTVWLGVSVVLSAAHAIRAGVGRVMPAEAKWAKRAVWSALVALLLWPLLSSMIVLLVPVALVAAVLSWRRELTRVRFVAAGAAGITVLLAGGALLVAAKEAGPSSTPLSAQERSRCEARGRPVTLSELVRVFRASGISLDLDEDTCQGSEQDRVRGARPDATNGGPSGLDQSDDVEAREGFVLCNVDEGSSAGPKVDVTKYDTDTEWYLRAYNVDCAIYPSSGESERAQVARLRKAFEALPPVAAS